MIRETKIGYELDEIIELYRKTYRHSEAIKMLPRTITGVLFQTPARIPKEYQNVKLPPQACFAPTVFSMGKTTVGILDECAAFIANLIDPVIRQKIHDE